MHKAKRSIIVLITILAILPAMCLAAGVSPGKAVINFFPNAMQTIEYTISGYGEFHITNKACEFLKFNNDTNKLETGTIRFSVTLMLPNKMEPGVHDCGFLIKQGKLNENINPSTGGSMGAISQVGAVIKINVPVKGKYATISLSADNANKGEPVYFKVGVNNLGDTPLKDLSAVIDVTDIDGNIMETIHTTSGDAEPFSGVELWKRMETTDYEPARYNARALLAYGGEKPAYAETTFLIGKLFVKFLNFQTNATAGKINPVNVDVESWWGDTIENVRAEISMFNASGVFKGNFRTESVDLQPWQKATLQGYWDTNGLEAGNYTANITLKYKGGETNENVKVMLQKQPEEEKTNESFEKIKGMLINPIFLAVIVIILVINVSVWIIKQKKQKKAAQ